MAHRYIIARMGLVLALSTSTLGLGHGRAGRYGPHARRPGSRVSAHDLRHGVPDR